MNPVLMTHILTMALMQRSESPPGFIDTEELEAKLSEAGPPQVLDVRLAADFDADPVVIPSAEWKDPGKVDDWAEDLSKDRPVVVYCVRGLQVSRGVAARLIEKGFDVLNLEGGIRAWKDAGGEVVPRKR